MLTQLTVAAGILETGGRVKTELTRGKISIICGQNMINMILHLAPHIKIGIFE